MRKRLSIVAMTAILLFCSACKATRNIGPLFGRDLYCDDGQVADACFEQVLKALEEQDREALKAIFSKQVLSEVNNMDERINYLFSFFQGRIASWENSAWCSDDSIRDRKRTTSIKSWYSVDTGQDEYLFFLLYYSTDEQNPDNEGRYALRVIKAKDKETQFTYWQDMNIPGIYKPEE